MSFVPSQKWRCSDGTAVFNASIPDKEFLSRLDARQEGFYSGDALRVILKMDQELNASGNITSHYSIDRVIEHLRGRAKSRFLWIRLRPQKLSNLPNPSSNTRFDL